MEAPKGSGKEISSSALSSPPGDSSFTLRKLARLLMVTEWLTLAAAAMLLSTVLLFVQRPWRHANTYPPGAKSWWLDSIEWNSVRGLPVIVGNINAVAFEPKSTRVWIAGNAGLLAYSDDGGDRWTKLEYDQPSGTFSVPTTPGNAPATSSLSGDASFSFPSRVEAAALAPQSAPSQQNRTPAQQSPAQTNGTPPSPAKTATTPQTSAPTTTQPTTAPTPQTSPPTTQQQNNSTSSQPSTTSVPYLIGMTREDAERNLQGAKLEIGEVGSRVDPRVGIVIDQSLKAGAFVLPGTHVSLVMGAQASPSKLPKIPIPSPQNSATASAGSTSTASGAGRSRGTQPSAQSLNWPAPDLLSLDIAESSHAVMSINASDSRVFGSADSGAHWNADLLSPNVFKSAAILGLNEKTYAYSYVPGQNSQPPRMKRGEGFFTFIKDQIIFSTGYGAPKLQMEVSKGAWLDVAGMNLVANSLWFSNPKSGCVVGYETPEDGGHGAVQCTSDIDKRWSRALETGKDKLNDVTIAPDGKVGWAVGEYGVVLWTGDGGEHWEARTQQAAIDLGASPPGKNWWRWLPPWFYAMWIFGLMCAAIAPLAQVESASIAFIQDYAASDKPLERGDTDALDFTSLAKSLSAFVRNSATKPPLTISIDGPWGSGKSSLMNLMCADLREFGFRAIWFNAWHNQKEQHLLAALLQTVRSDAVPRLWDPSGIGFRCRLIGHRLQRYWFPMLLVTGAAVFLFAFDYYHSVTSHHSLLVDLPRLLPKWLGGTGKEAGGLFAALNNWPSLGTLLSLIAIWPVVKKLLQAFGTNPAALLTVISRGNRIADLDAEISFREKFAKEFRDVTQSLGNDHQLVVFIDDLDRCRPENVRDILEAVNFLVSSGECFVVMGLERKSVIAAVGLSMKEMAAEMYGKPLKDDDPALVAARQEYARNFLDKLINLEVPIPALDTAKARGLFYAGARNPATDPIKAEEDARQREWAQRGEQFAHFTVSAGRFLIALLLSVTLVWGAFKAGLWIDGYERDQVAAQLHPASAAALSATPAATAPQIVNPAAGIQTASLPAPASPTASSEPSPEIDPGASPRPAPWQLSWPEFAAMALLITIAYSALVASKQGATHDSPKFIEALEIWYPLVIARQRTPRAVKRWMNRVRYLATRELPSSELRTPMERFADWYAARRAVIDGVRADAIANQDAQESKKIPEELVVVLAAIFEFDPEILTGITNFANLLDVSQTTGISEKGSANPLICDMRARHIEKMGSESWNQIARFAKRFLDFWPEIIVR
jgi:KAP-like P-loop domain-containing protein/PASTA domain-containing protein